MSVYYNTNSGRNMPDANTGLKYPSRTALRTFTVALSGRLAIIAETMTFVSITA